MTEDNDLPKPGDAEAEAENPESEPQSGEGDTRAKPLRSPWTTEVIHFFDNVEDEVLAVLLRGNEIGKSQIGMAIAGPFLQSLNLLIHAIATSISGRQAGSRGKLPEVPRAGLLALAGVEWGSSATFHFALGAGEVFRIDEPSVTQEAVAELNALLVSTATEKEEDLFQNTRRLGLRVGVDYSNVIQVLSQHHIDSIWRTREEERSIGLPIEAAERAKVMLAREEAPRTNEEVLDGYLYRVDSKDQTFVLEPTEREEEKITGTYDPALREQLRGAWGKVVRVRLLETHHFLARQIEPFDVERELLRVEEIIAAD